MCSWLFKLNCIYLCQYHIYLKTLCNFYWVFDQDCFDRIHLSPWKQSNLLIVCCLPVMKLADVYKSLSLIGDLYSNSSNPQDIRFHALFVVLVSEEHLGWYLFRNTQLGLPVLKFLHMQFEFTGCQIWQIARPDPLIYVCCLHRVQAKAGPRELQRMELHEAGGLGPSGLEFRASTLQCVYKLSGHRNQIPCEGIWTPSLREFVDDTKLGGAVDSLGSRGLTERSG